MRISLNDYLIIIPDGRAILRDESSEQFLNAWVVTRHKLFNLSIKMVMKLY